MADNDQTELWRKIVNDPDFVALKRYGYSLKTLMERYPDGAPEHVIASALLVSEAMVETLHQRAVERLRALMGVDL